MTPNSQLRLQSMLRSMQQSIIPALDPQDSLAQEQAKLLMGHIMALQGQAGNEAEIIEKEHQSLIVLAKQLLENAHGGVETMRAKSQLESAIVGGDTVALSAAVEKLLCSQDAGDSFKTASWDLTLTYSLTAAQNGREWFKVMGF